MKAKRPSSDTFSYRAILVAIVSQIVRACFHGVSAIARYVAKWGIAQMCLCETKYQGGVSHHLGGVLTSLKKYRAIWGIAAIVSHYRAKWATRHGNLFVGTSGLPNAIFVKFSFPREVNCTLVSVRSFPSKMLHNFYFRASTRLPTFVLVGDICSGNEKRGH